MSQSAEGSPPLPPSWVENLERLRNSFFAKTLGKASGVWGYFHSATEGEPVKGEHRAISSQRAGKFSGGIVFLLECLCRFYRPSDIKERAINNGHLEGRSHASSVQAGTGCRKGGCGQVLAAVGSKHQRGSLLSCASALRNAKVPPQKVPIDIVLLVDETVTNGLETSNVSVDSNHLNFFTRRKPNVGGTFPVKPNTDVRQQAAACVI